MLSVEAVEPLAAVGDTDSHSTHQAPQKGEGKACGASQAAAILLLDGMAVRESE